MEGSGDFAHCFLTLFSRLDVTKLGREYSCFSSTHLGHELVHCEIGTKCIGACIGNGKTLEELLHLAVFSIFAMKSDEDHVELPQDFFGWSHSPPVMPLSRLIDIDVASDILLLGQIRNDRGARFQR